MKTLLSIAGIDVLENEDGSYEWTAGMMIDADGHPEAYHPQKGKGLDALGNAGTRGNWWALVTDNGKATGEPIVQRDTDPAPGYYVSTTALELSQYQRTDPRRYIHSGIVPFVVVPPQVRKQAKGVVLGCRATITFQGKSIEAVVADIGPRNKIGEASMAAARALGIKDNPRTGGRGSGVTYRIYPGRPARLGQCMPLIPA